MFGWLRRKQGFEWHDYVRTTIKLRREDRRRKVESLGGAIAQSGQSAAGGLSHGVGVVWRSMLRGIASLGRSIAALAGARGLGSAFRQASALVGSPLVRLLAGIAGFALAASAGASLWATRWDLQSGAIAAASAVLISLALWPEICRFAVSPVANLFGRLCDRLPWLGRISGAVTPLGIGAGIVVGVSALVTAGWQTLSPSSSLMPAVTRLITGSTGLIEGRGTAVGPDLLRVGDTLVRLAEIEAPATDQRCPKTSTGSSKGRRQTVPCTRAAFDLLQTRVKGQTVTCRASGKDAGGNATARCTIAGSDIAQDLVRAGLATSKPGVFASYAADESAAKSAGSGLWSPASEQPPKKR